MDQDRGADILHQQEPAAAHVAPVGLDQCRSAAACRGDAGEIVEDPPVAAVGDVPGGISRPLGLGTFQIGLNRYAVLVLQPERLLTIVT